MRLGIGYDIHRLKKGRKLFLGGVEIAYPKGLLGHSDADVLLHAISDALLGAAGAYDIGKHFPDTDPKYKGIASKKILKEVLSIIAGKGFSINNIDTVIIAEKPKMAPFVEDMREAISSVLGIDKELINIKATTTEGIGAIGCGDAISAYAVATLGERT